LPFWANKFLRLKSAIEPGPNIELKNFSFERRKMLEERRQYPRLVPSTPLFVSMDDAKSGLLLDLCEGGLAVASLVPRNLDDVVSLAFDLPEGVGHIEAKAQIAWTRDSGHLTGVRFMDLDEVSQQQLSEWIAAGTNLRPAGSEEMDEPVIVTRSTYAQVDAIRRAVRPEILPDMRMEMQPQIEMRAAEARVEEPVEPAEVAMETSIEAEPAEAAEKNAPSTEMMGTLFPEPAVEEQSFASEVGDVETEKITEPHEVVEMANEAHVVVEAPDTETAKIDPNAPGSTTREEWLEHVAQMEEAPAGARFDAGPRTLPPDAETVGWASDAVGWVTEIAEKRVTAPEEAEFDGVYSVEPMMAGRRARQARSRHTIELVLAVVLLTWALVFLGYQMGSTGLSRTAHDVTPSKPGANGASAKSDSGKMGNPSTASFASAEAFPEMSPVPPINGRSSAAAPNSASLEAPPSMPNRAVIAAPKPSTPTPSAHETINPAGGTMVVAGPAPAMNSGVVLQVGAMKMEGNATALMQDLKKKKFSAFVYRHGNDSLYRVGVGPFGDRDSSAKVKSELEKNGYKTITAKWVKDKD
jgi:cell division septation protein DedD